VPLQTLKLNGNYGGVLGGSALAKGVGLNSSLRELHLHGNNIGDEGMRILGEELLRREKDFKKVKVSCSRLMEVFRSKLVAAAGCTDSWTNWSTAPRVGWH
jgi:Ran GTPase-activating protein (RanGAP) involved in mRNA processing and transport